MRDKPSKEERTAKEPNSLGELEDPSKIPDAPKIDTRSIMIENQEPRSVMDDNQEPFDQEQKT